MQSEVIFASSILLAFSGAIYGLIQSRRAAKVERSREDWRGIANRAQAGLAHAEAQRRKAEDQTTKVFSENDALRSTVRRLNVRIDELAEHNGVLSRSNRTLRGNYTKLSKKLSAQGAAAKQGG